ncbi:MAG: hypothetical protein WCE44_15255 [Candidatus Velthaea sp.]|jgi:hypothetical protein
MEDERRGWRLRIDASEALIEFVSIVLAIVLATAVNEWRQDAQTKKDTRAALVAIRQEIETNRAVLEPRLRHHAAVSAAFGALQDRSNRVHFASFDQFWNTWRSADPNGFGPFAGASTSWDVAQSTGLLRNVDFGTLRVLVISYGLQGRVNLYVDRLIADLHFVPVDGNNAYYAVSGLNIDLGDLTSNERALLETYRKALDALDRAGVHD